jgi:hypothetical protein
MVEASGWRHRQQVLEQLMRQIMDYDDEFRREEATSTVGSDAKH